MKKFFIIALSALALAFTTSCEPSSTEEKPNNEGYFQGKVTVDNADGSKFEDSNVMLVISEPVDGKCDITIAQVKFADKMPVRIDMTIPGVSISNLGVLSGNNIVPLAAGGPFPAYTITDLQGVVEKTLNGQYTGIVLGMKCGSYPTSYSGEFFPIMEE